MPRRSILTDLIVRPFAITLAWIFFRLSTPGRRNLPRKGGFILAGNHISDWDPPFVGISVPRAAFFMAKSELFRNPLIGAFLRGLGAFPVHRRASVHTKALRTAEEVVKGGKVLIIFPEGTRSKDGNLLPAKPGVGYIAAATGAPVYPFCIQGTDDPVGAFLFRHRFRVTFGERIDPKTISQLHEEGGPRKTADYIMSKVSDMKEATKKGAQG